MRQPRRRSCWPLAVSRNRLTSFAGGAEVAADQMELEGGMSFREYLNYQNQWLANRS